MGSPDQAGVDDRDLTVLMGPSAASSRVRMTARRRVGGGEGFAIEVGNDGDVACAFIDTGASLDLLSEDDVSEMDWRQASQVMRFASLADREMYLAGQSFGATEAADTDPIFLRGAFTLDLLNELGGERCEVKVANTGEALLAKVRLVNRERGSDVVWEPKVALWEWARFRQELSLLNVARWRHYPSTVSDGMSWSLSYFDGVSLSESGGQCAFPPDGASPFPQDPAFFRMIMCVERMLGRQLWGNSSSAALPLPDPVDATEHLLLAAARQWASTLSTSGPPPGTLKEPDLENGMCTALRGMGKYAELPDGWLSHQVVVKGLMADWAGPGALDLRLETGDHVAWVELKWAKDANTLHNCLWDAAKIARALRDGHAHTGYLLAGAPVSEWQRTKPIRGSRSPLPARLFDSTVFDGDSIVRGYPTWWAGWRNENTNTFPQHLPTPIFSTIVGSVLIPAADGDDWIIKLARIQTAGTRTFDPLEAMPCD